VITAQDGCRAWFGFHRIDPANKEDVYPIVCRCRTSRNYQNC
jgi:hypothetical protein